jgi:methyltransferase
MVTRILFTAFLGLLAIQRITELRRSQRNETLILRRGGREHAASHFFWMKSLHTAWFAAMLIEVFGLRRPFIPPLTLAALAILATGQLLRYAAIRTLGWRWTVKVMTVPGVEPVQRGIYHIIRHPNYLGVMLEILAVPLLHTAYITAASFSLANGVLIGIRIREEEKALSSTSIYGEVFQGRPRFFPKKRIERRSDE